MLLMLFPSLHLILEVKKDFPCLKYKLVIKFHEIALFFILDKKVYVCKMTKFLILVETNLMQVICRDKICYDRRCFTFTIVRKKLVYLYFISLKSGTHSVRLIKGTEQANVNVLGFN